MNKVSFVLNDFVEIFLIYAGSESGACARCCAFESLQRQYFHERRTLGVLAFGFSAQHCV